MIQSVFWIEDSRLASQTTRKRDNELPSLAGPDLGGGGLGPSPGQMSRGCPFPPPPKKKFRKNIFLQENVGPNVKFGHISGKYCVKFEHFVNFSYLRGKNALLPQQLTAPTPIWALLGIDGQL